MDWSSVSESSVSWPGVPRRSEGFFLGLTGEVALSKILGRGKTMFTSIDLKPEKKMRICKEYFVVFGNFGNVAFYLDS